MGFYGNITNASSTQLTYDKTYSTVVDMQNNAESDGIYVGRYVLVDYHFPDENRYDSNYRVDFNKYKKTYDSTIWQKIYNSESQSEKYVMIAELNSVVPIIELRTIAPEDNADGDYPRFTSDSSNLKYNLEIPNTWDLQAGTLNFNANGFKKDKSNIDNTDDYIRLDSFASGRAYNEPNSNSTKQGKDSYRLNINLPSIGNTISEVYDVLKGDGRNDAYPSLYGIRDAYKNLTDEKIPVYKNNTITGVDIGSFKIANSGSNFTSKNEKIQSTDSITNAFAKSQGQIDNLKDLIGDESVETQLKNYVAIGELESRIAALLESFESRLQNLESYHNSNEEEPPIDEPTTEE